MVSRSIYIARRRATRVHAADLHTYQIVTNTQRATNGLPALVLSQNVHNNLGAGGLISGPANFSLRNYTFDGDGTIRPFDAGDYARALISA